MKNIFTLPILTCLLLVNVSANSQQNTIGVPEGLTKTIQTDFKDYQIATKQQYAKLVPYQTPVLSVYINEDTYLDYVVTLVSKKDNTYKIVLFLAEDSSHIDFKVSLLESKDLSKEKELLVYQYVQITKGEDFTERMYYSPPGFEYRCFEYEREGKIKQASRCKKAIKEINDSTIIKINNPISFPPETENDLEYCEHNYYIRYGKLISDGVCD